MASEEAKAVSLKVRPSQSVDLCFEVSGIIGEWNSRLAAHGAQVDACPLDSYYGHLLDSANSPSRPGLLKYDSKGIHDALTSGMDPNGNPVGGKDPNGNPVGAPGPLLFALRAENVKAVMDKAINLRENSYYQKYARKSDIINRTLADYQPTVTYTGNITNGSNSVTGLSSVANIAIGAAITGPGIPIGTTVTAVNGSATISLSANATATAAGISLTFSTTFTLPSSVPKPNRLDALVSTSETQHVALRNAYSNDPVRNPTGTSQGVVQTTTTDVVTLTSAIYSGNTVSGSNAVTNLSSIANLAVGTAVTGPGIPTSPPTTITSITGANSITLSANATATGVGVNLTFGGLVQSHSDTQTYNMIPPAQTGHSQALNRKTVGGTVQAVTDTTTSNDLTQNTQTNATHSDSSTDATRQHTESKGYGFQYPSADNDAQYQRAQASLTDERYSQFLFQQNLPYLSTVFDNELESIDLDVKRLQISYINAILVSPIKGIVTGVFRDPGDCVQAGQPVMRVENNDQVLIIGTLKFRGVLRVGTPIRIKTKLYDAPLPDVTIPDPLTKPPAKVVAIRGHDSEDEQWDVIIACDNLSANNVPILPINYNFDFDDTTVIINPNP